ncbi:protein of unknown function [Albimonas donghaensis]|uniref:DUF4381 domain-containing protein n=1 Tax=Albimonas donghaensis TaxID=356660 RepID=A0A1H2QK83_9RHOB|nr:DUF4381 domain-containing protein [Albimonas donghaensis]SDW07571.1 protein of unknown function [Albimonas donghaensis]
MSDAAPDAGAPGAVPPGAPETGAGAAPGAGVAVEAGADTTSASTSASGADGVVTPPESLVGLLDQLAQPVPPPPISMAPQTAGWAVAGVVLLILLALVAIRAARRRRANAYRRAALAALARAGDDPAAVAAILRRTALVAYPREQVAGLHGAAWLRFLDETAGAGAGGGLSDGPGAALIAAPYAPGPHAVPGLGAAAADWVRRHRAPEAVR